MLRVAEIGPNRQKPKQRAQHVLAFRHPGHRLDVQRMQGKKRGHPRAGPPRAGEVVQQQEKQNGIGQVQQQTGQVMAQRLHAVKLPIQRVREPGDGMPVGGAGGGKGPLDALPIQAVLNSFVGRDVIRVVKQNEIAVERRPKHGQHRRAQQQANEPFLPSASEICHRL
jgi:hypothetical protein